MRNQLGLLLLMLCIGVSSAEAANIKVLLPIVLQSPVAGAFGSLWASRVTILNVSDHPFFVTGFSPPCGFDSCVQPELAPGLTTALSPGNVVGDVPGTFLLVDATEHSNLKVELRVQDLSRQADTWGTEIPVNRRSKSRAANRGAPRCAVGSNVSVAGARI